MQEASLKSLRNVCFQLYDILEKAKTIEIVKRSVVSIGRAEEIFKGVETILYDTVTVDS